MTNKGNREKQDISHIYYANFISFFVLIAYFVAKLLYFQASGDSGQSQSFLLAMACALGLMACSFFFAENPGSFAFFVPGSMAFGLFFFAIIDSGLPYLFMALAALCSVSATYLSIKY